MRGWTDRVRQLTAGLGALAAGMALMVWGAAPASAGGPTSALVVSPESEETASVYYSDSEYGKLERLLGPVGKGTRARPPEDIRARERLINVTWMVHDVTPWRVDRILMAEAGQDAWIHTAERFNETPNGLWHRATDPSDLYKLLYSMGVMGEGTGTGSGSGIYPAPWETEQAEQAEPAVAAPSETRAAPVKDDGTDWWWAIPGVVAGAGLALVLGPQARRLPLLRGRERDSGPRQELLDT
ncbi:hypothetical protein ACIO8H_12275 [Streptomyces sp. NPDC087226]|uniref:hypothetical protein n=1 Tax=Streptomyces sp. NPDC087226 TaxID=3365771 RepID=UPI0037F87537